MVDPRKANSWHIEVSVEVLSASALVNVHVGLVLSCFYALNQLSASAVNPGYNF